MMMSDVPDHEFDPLLLDFHLGRLADEQRAELMDRLERDPRLAAQNDALKSVFEALQLARDEVVPVGLVERISSSVAGLPAPPRVAAAGPTLGEPDDTSGGWVIRMHSLRDIVAVAALIVLAVGIGVPSLLNMRARSQRVLCSANLEQLGRGLGAYAASAGGNLPFVGWTSRNSWRPTDDPDAVVLPNRRHVFPLLQVGHARPTWFVCPSLDDIPMPADQARGRNDFIESRNLSYAYQNMAGVRPTPRNQPDLPILADDNPLFDDGLPLFEMRRKLGLTDSVNANSRAHKRAGQNILTLDGSVKWMTTPNAGVNGDNIWTLDRVLRYTGREGPKSATDSHLLK